MDKDSIDSRTTKTINFINRGVTKFGGRIDYSLVKDIANQKDRIDIICKIHGKDNVVVKSHLASEFGCMECARSARKVTRATVIQRAKEKFGDKFDYSALPEALDDMRTSVKITCPIHGELDLTPYSHINSKYGCKDCSEDALLDTLEDFLSKAVKVHGDKYNYENTVFSGYKVELAIICPTHGEFEQIAENHTSGSGCPKCAIDKTRLRLDDVIEEINIILQGTATKYVSFEPKERRASLICSEHGEYSQLLTNMRKGYLCTSCKK